VIYVLSYHSIVTFSCVDCSSLESGYFENLNEEILYPVDEINPMIDLVNSITAMGVKLFLAANRQLDRFSFLDLNAHLLKGNGEHYADIIHHPGALSRHAIAILLRESRERGGCEDAKRHCTSEYKKMVEKQKVPVFPYYGASVCCL
jgi:hypothetical protein